MAKAKVEISEERIQEFCHKWRIRELALFGSVLSEQFGSESDVDVLVSIEDEAGWSTFDLADMIEELKTMFGREVDLVEKEALRNPYRRHSIMSNREVLYAA